MAFRIVAVTDEIFVYVGGSSDDEEGDYHDEGAREDLKKMRSLDENATVEAWVRPLRDIRLIKTAKGQCIGGEQNLLEPVAPAWEIVFVDDSTVTVPSSTRYVAPSKITDFMAIVRVEFLAS